MKKTIILILIIMLLLSMFCVNVSFAADDGINAIASAMNNVGKPTGYESSKTATVINNVIGIIQIVGTGISLIVISLLGVKYILASPSEKADVKKNIMPILIGCILLFAGVNIVGIIENFTTDISLVSG